MDQTQRPANIRVTRRQFLSGAAASAALLTAGGAAATIALRERDGGAPSASSRADATVEPSADAFAVNDVRLRHLLRRTTFAPTPADLRRFRGIPLDRVVDALLDSASDDDSETDAAIAALGYDRLKPGDVVATWLARLMMTRRPMLERMTLFWHGLLTSGLSKTGPRYAGTMLTQNQFFRDYAFDRFDVLLKGVVRDPAMMLWLDIQTSKKGRPNENYARELMELFTLGPGNYTEQDVRESARAHTGYSIDKDKGFAFRPGQHDSGAKTFLGQTGDFDADAIVDIILQQDAAPRHFARKLFESFVYPYPDPATIEPIARVARDSGFDTKQVLRAVLTCDAFYSPQAYRALVKSPTDYVIGAVRLLGAQPDARLVAQASRTMGQTLFDPPNVAGWPGGRTWLGTSTWFARVNSAAALLNGGGRVGHTGITSIFPQPPASADGVIEQAALATVDGNIGDGARETLRAYLDEGGGFASLPEKQRDERLHGLVALLFASPEYQLA